MNGLVLVIEYVACLGVCSKEFQEKYEQIIDSGGQRLQVDFTVPSLQHLLAGALFSASPSDTVCPRPLRCVVCIECASVESHRRAGQSRHGTSRGAPHSLTQGRSPRRHTV